MEFKEVWKYVLGEDYVGEFDNKYGLSLDNEYVTIEGNTVTVKTGYAWNGLESKYFADSKIITFILKLIKNINAQLVENGLPQIWEATLLFDVFMQHREKFNGVALKIALPLLAAGLTRAGVPAWVTSIVTGTISVFISK